MRKAALSGGHFSFLELSFQMVFSGLGQVKPFKVANTGGMHTIGALWKRYTVAGVKTIVQNKNIARGQTRRGRFKKPPDQPSAVY
ncbi:hypothetical protein SAMN02745123_00783 [Desulforamulus aeronauticus DSM 10349]|uniref:Uncharacterized protein n=1 Tax=Desulforamulus aeronauticus DSM 10349 TaxID=1121421 RepID=A0A1M6PY61_9FIRM|nr:hypothetical protein SAMN02745123_00783 [Desulforamulus aeronauticus DSM 10349]